MYKSSSEAYLFTGVGFLKVEINEKADKFGLIYGIKLKSHTNLHTFCKKIVITNNKNVKNGHPEI